MLAAAQPFAIHLQGGHHRTRSAPPIFDMNWLAEHRPAKRCAALADITNAANSPLAPCLVKRKSTPLSKRQLSDSPLDSTPIRKTVTCDDKKQRLENVRQENVRTIKARTHRRGHSCLSLDNREGHEKKPIKMELKIEDVDAALTLDVKVKEGIASGETPLGRKASGATRLTPRKVESSANCVPLPPFVSGVNLAKRMGEFLTKMCDYNFDHEVKLAMPTDVRIFDAATIYKNLPKFLQRLFEEVEFHESCFVMALIYLNRLQEKGFSLTWYNVHRVLLTSLLVADKVLDDDHESCAFYSRVSGIGLESVRQMEGTFLDAIQFNVFVFPHQFTDAQRWIQRFNHPSCLEGSNFPNFL